jgi:hypothetical protein
MDGETFGHHRPGLETLLFDLLKIEEITPIMLSDLEKYFSRGGSIKPRNCTWASSEREIEQDKPFNRWRNSENQIHMMQWELTNLAIKVGADDEKVRNELDRAIHSDQYWWASASPWWSLEMIERGAWELRNVVKKATNARSDEIRRVDELYRDILFTGFNWQRSGRVDEISRSADEDVQERLEMKEIIVMTSKDYELMIKNLKNQIKLSVKTEEYHRAAMIKDRVKELEEEMKKVV